MLQAVAAALPAVVVVVVSRVAALAALVAVEALAALEAVAVVPVLVPVLLVVALAVLGALLKWLHTSGPHWPPALTQGTWPRQCEVYSRLRSAFPTISYVLICVLREQLIAAGLSKSCA